MVATTLAPDRPRSDVAGRDLVLRISGSPRDGQVVRLKSAKCTIGSGRHCTLRIRANGVAPVHCLILRGQTETVVRRWSADTRLNDQSFTDAPLYPGDRLSIGPIELDVLGIGVHATPVVEEPESNPFFDSASGVQFEQLSARLAEFEGERESFEQQRGRWQAERETSEQRLDEQRGQLAAQQTELETERNTLTDERRQWHAQQEQNAAQAKGQAEQFATRLAELESERQSFEQQRGQWQAELEAAQRRLDEQRGQLAARQTELDTVRNALTDERRQWEAQREQDVAQVSGQAEQVNARLAEFESERQSLEQQRVQWQAELEAAQRRLDEQRGQLAARQTELDTVRNALTDERRQWEAQREQDVAQVSGQAEQVNARLAEFESERQSLEQQRVQWQAEQEAAEQRFDEQRGQLAARQTELDTVRNALTDERRQWEAQREQDVAQVSGQAEQANAQLAEFERERQSLEQQRSQWQAEREAAEQRLDEQRGQLATQQTELATERSALAEERRRWERKQAESPTVVKRLAEASETSVEAEALPVPAAQEPQFEEPAAQAPVDLADVFRRVGATIALPDEEPDQSYSPAPIVGPRDTASEPTAKPPVALAPEESAEESIDDYMGRLMQRLRSTTGDSEAGSRPSQRPEPPRAAQEDASAAPSAESTISQSTVASPMPGDEPCEPATSLPRARALQKPINMSALRELANLSAHHALKRYSRRVLINSMHAKLILSGVAFAAGGALLWMWNLRHQHNLTFYSAIVAFLVGIYGVVQYALMTGRLIVNESGQLKWNAFRPGKITPPPAADSVEKSPHEDGNPVAPGDTPSSTVI